MPTTTYTDNNEKDKQSYMIDFGVSINYSARYQVLSQILITLIVRNHKTHSTKHKTKVIVFKQSL